MLFDDTFYMANTTNTFSSATCTHDTHEHGISKGRVNDAHTHATHTSSIHPSHMTDWKGETKQQKRRHRREEKALLKLIVLKHADMHNTNSNTICIEKCYILMCLPFVLFVQFDFLLFILSH